MAAVPNIVPNTHPNFQVRLFAGNNSESTAMYLAEANDFNALAHGGSVLVHFEKPMGDMLHVGRELALLRTLDQATPARPGVLGAFTPHRICVPRWVVVAALLRVLPHLLDTEYMHILWADDDDAECSKMQALLASNSDDESDSDSEDIEDHFVSFCNPLLVRQTVPFVVRA